MSLNKIYQFLVRSGEDFGDKVAVEDQYGSLTFAELYSQADTLRAELLNAGVGKKMIVGIVFENSREFVMALFAVLGTGAVVMPVYPALSAGEREEIYKTASIAFLIGTLKTLRSELKKFDHLTNWQSHPILRLNAGSVDPLSHIEEPACMRFSSGTTGKSKGVVLSRKSVDERTAAVYSSLDLKPDDRVLWVLPMAFHYIATIITFVRYGIGLVICPSFYAKEIIEWSNQKEATVLYASPMHIRLLAGDQGRDRFTSMKRVISTSGGIDQASCDQFNRRMGLPVTQAFGIIEIGIPIVNLNGDVCHSSRLGRIREPYQFTILNEAGETLQAGQVGRLGLRGPGMFDGYMFPPVKAKDILHNGWFLTGDNAEIHRNGSIELKGREKSVINVGGNKVFPEEVEFALESLQMVAEAHVIAEVHGLLGEVVVARVVPRDPESFDSGQVLEGLRSKLTTYKIPKRIEVVSSIGKTATGKKLRIDS